MTTLGFERGTAQVRDQIRYAWLLEKMIAEARRQLGADCALSSDEMGARLAQLRADMAAARAMTYMVVSRAAAGLTGAESLMRAMVGETQQRARRLALDILGPRALENPEDDDWVYYYLRSFAITIAAGTSQIQRNIIGERVLGLPR